MFIIILKSLFFILSNIGFWEGLRRHTKVNINFLPSLTIAIDVALLFVSGVLRILPIMTWALLITGLGYLIIVIIKDKGIRFIKNYFKISYLFAIITMMIMAIFLSGQIFLRYDNFSHWATVVKCMLINNRFPNSNDSIIMFQAYPLGSSVYIYFFSKLTSLSESTQMLAQVYIMTACIMPIFTFVKKNKIVALITMLSFTNFFFVYNIKTYDLPVDTLLPIVSACAWLYILSRCFNCME